MSEEHQDSQSSAASGDAGGVVWSSETAVHSMLGRIEASAMDHFATAIGEDGHDATEERTRRLLNFLYSVAENLKPGAIPDGSATQHLSDLVRDLKKLDEEHPTKPPYYWEPVGRRDTASVLSSHCLWPYHEDQNGNCVLV